jgi:HSP20 family protein
MAIQLWDPMREMVSLRDVMNSLLQESFIRPGAFQAEGGAAMLPLDISENENEFVIKASLPGIRPEDVQITVHGETLTIRGEMTAEEEKKDEHYHLRERRYGSFQRTVKLSAPVRSDEAKADFENGVLTLTLPKSEEAKPKQIKVGARRQNTPGQGQASGKAAKSS